jgi:Coenzyme PQQ synthesis protein D (PqqD)
MRLLSELMFTISESIRCTPTEDGCIVLDTRHGQILSLNVVGSRIFGLVQRGFNQAQIADEISRDFEMSLQIVRADVFDFLANLQKHKILQPCRPDGVF